MGVNSVYNHPSGVAVFLTDQSVRFTLPDGKTTETPAKRGQALWTKGGVHLPENLSDKPMELILVELKTAQAKSD